MKRKPKKQNKPEDMSPSGLFFAPEKKEEKQEKLPDPSTWLTPVKFKKLTKEEFLSIFTKKVTRWVNKVRVLETYHGEKRWDLGLIKSAKIEDGHLKMTYSDCFDEMDFILSEFDCYFFNKKWNLIIMPKRKATGVVSQPTPASHWEFQSENEAIDFKNMFFAK